MNSLAKAALSNTVVIKKQLPSQYQYPHHQCGGSRSRVHADTSHVILKNESLPSLVESDRVPTDAPTRAPSSPSSSTRRGRSTLTKKRTSLVKRPSFALPSEDDQEGLNKSAIGSSGIMRRVVSLSIFPTGGGSCKASSDGSGNLALHSRAAASRRSAEMVQCEDVFEDIAPLKPLKSCMSVTNLAESLDNDGLAPTSLSRGRSSAGNTSNSLRRLRRTESTPALAGMAYAGADQPRLKRNVSFHKVEVRNFKVCVGDNPSVVNGPPVSLDWKYHSHESLDFDEYEENRGPRRTKAKMRTTRSVREARLRWEGYSDAEIANAVREADKTAYLREETVRMLHSMKGEEMMENAARKIKNFVTMNSDKKEQKKLWKKAQKRGSRGPGGGVRVPSLIANEFPQKQASAVVKVEDKDLSSTVSLSDSESSSCEELQISLNPIAGSEPSLAEQLPVMKVTPIEDEINEDGRQINGNNYAGNDWGYDSDEGITF